VRKFSERSDVRQTKSGWYLPADDKYFDKFTPPTEWTVPGDKLTPDDKKNSGFQRPHLWCAFEYVENWGVAVDVGAHCGYWAWDMAGKFGKVYAFEAHPVTVECLKRNMAAFDNVFVFHAAVGDGEGRVEVKADPTPKRKGNSRS
jgi:hypothetical protein